MKQYILNYLRKKLFAGEYAKLELQRRTITEKSVNEQIQLLTRLNLACFDPRAVDKGEDILDIVMEEDGDDTEFLKQCVDLSKNTAWQRIQEWLKREQVVFTAKESQNIDTLNFSRGSVNGLVLEQEVVDRLVGVYRERTSHKDDQYDNHEVI